MGTKQTGRTQLVATAMHVRSAGALAGGTLRLCLHQAEATHRLLARQGIHSEVQLGAAHLTIGRDRISPLEMVYDPREMADEWHAWVRVGSLILDASIGDLHQQMLVTGQADAATYQRARPFLHDVLVARPAKIRPSRYIVIPGVEIKREQLLASPTDMLTVEQMIGR